MTPDSAAFADMKKDGGYGILDEDEDEDDDLGIVRRSDEAASSASSPHSTRGKQQGVGGGVHSLLTELGRELRMVELEKETVSLSPAAKRVMSLGSDNDRVRGGGGGRVGTGTGIGTGGGSEGGLLGNAEDGGGAPGSYDGGESSVGWKREGLADWNEMLEDKAKKEKELQERARSLLRGRAAGGPAGGGGESFGIPWL